MRKPCSAATPVATPTRPGSGISAVAGVAGTPAPVPSSATASTADRLVRALQGPLIRGDGELGGVVPAEPPRPRMAALAQPLAQRGVAEQALDRGGHRVGVVRVEVERR